MLLTVTLQSIQIEENVKNWNATVISSHIAINICQFVDFWSLLR